MYKTPYKELTNDQKQSVCVGQVHTHWWFRDHQRRCIFTIGEAHCPQNLTQLWAASACKGLLRNCMFHTAINHDIPNDAYWKFTPLLYQATEIAKICTQHSGLGLIFDEVRSSWQFLFIICSWYSCAPLGCPSWLLLQFACKVTAGFNNKPVFINFTSAMVTLAECHDWGHDLQGMQSIPSRIQWVVPWTLLYFPCGIPQLPHKLWRQDGWSRASTKYALRFPSSN